jgi:site-specific recombinase XerD
VTEYYRVTKLTLCVGDTGHPEDTTEVASATLVKVALSTGCRSSKVCPECKAKVIHIPRHLRNCHGWTPDESRCAVKKFKLKSLPKQIPKQKDYHRRRPCPVDGCHAYVKRLSAHLRTHKIPPGSLMYRRLLRKARAESKHCSSVTTPQSSNDSALVSSAAEQLQHLSSSHLGIKSASAEMLLDSDSRSADSLSSAESVMSAAGQQNSRSSVSLVSPVVSAEVRSVEDAVSERQVTAECELMNDSAILQTEFHKFMMWMTSPDGGMKNSKSAKQHVTQTQAIQKITGKLSLSALWHYSVLDAFTAYAQQKKYLPATIKSYLNSLKHFYQFVTASSIVTGTQVHEVTKMLERVKHWIAAYRKQCSKHTQQKMNEDLDKLVHPEDVESFRNSEATLAVIKILGSLADDNEIVTSQTDYVLVRDFLLTEIALMNANRSGVLANMTLKQFKNARVVEDQYVVSVDDHKTATLYGPAKVVLSQSLHGWLVLFTDKMRIPLISCHSQGNCDAMFVTWNGESMSSGQITKCVQSSWKKAGLKDGISLNIVRKSAVSTVHQKRPEMSSQLADLMCHRLSTAQKSYRIVEREKTSVMASKGLREAMASSSTAVSNEPVVAKAVHPASTRDSQAMYSSATRLLWDAQKVSALNTHFQPEIAAKTVTVQSVREKLNGIEELAGLSYRQVYDKLRSVIDNKPPDHTCMRLPTEIDSAADRVQRMLLAHKSTVSVNTQANDDESEAADDSADESCIPPSSKAKDIFCKEDVVAVTKLCASIIARGPVSDTRISSVLSQSAVGAKLLKEYTLFQLRNRIKYERRKCSMH